MAGARQRARPAAKRAEAEAAATKSQRRRAAIVARATELFDRQGYANTSLDDIAREVGIAREGIYYYFRNRAEILLTIIAPQSRALIEGLKRILADPALDPPARLAAAVGNHLEQFDRYCLEMTVSLRDGLLEDAGDVRSAMRKIWKDYERLWTRLIDEGQRAGAFRAIGDPKMLAFGVLGMCNWLARWYDPKKGRPIGELVDAYTSMLAGGLVRGGREPD